jgi:hypothetical protein
MKKEKVKERKCEWCGSKHAFLSIVDLKDEYLKTFLLCAECCSKIPLKEFENDRYGFEFSMSHPGEFTRKGIVDDDYIRELDKKRVKRVLKLEGMEIYVEIIYTCYWCGSQNPSITICEPKNQKSYWICEKCYQNIPIKERKERYVTYPTFKKPSSFERLSGVKIIAKQPTQETYKLLERFAEIDRRLDEELKK